LDRQQDAERGGDPFPALKTKEIAEDVAQKSAEPCGSRQGGGLRRGLCDQYRSGAFASVTDERQKGCSFVTGAQHIGSARVFRSESTRIRQAEEFTGDQRKGNGSERVAKEQREQDVPTHR